MGKITFGNNGSITFKGGTITFRNLGLLENPEITDIKIRPGTSDTIIDYKVTNNDTHSDAILFSRADKNAETSVNSLNNKGLILKERGTITTSDSNSPYGQAAKTYVHAFFQDPSGERENSNIITVMKIVGSIIPPDIYDLAEAGGNLSFKYRNLDPEAINLNFEAQKTIDSGWVPVGSTGVGVSGVGTYSISLPGANSSVKIRVTATKTDRPSALKESSSYDYYLGKVADPTISRVYYTEDPTEYWFSVKNNYQKSATVWARQKNIGPWKEFGLINPRETISFSIAGTYPGSFGIEAYMAIGSVIRNSDTVLMTNKTPAPYITSSVFGFGRKLTIRNGSSRIATLIVKKDNSSGNPIIETSLGAGTSWTSGVLALGSTYHISITGAGQTEYTRTYTLPEA